MKRLRGELDEQRRRLRKSELLRAADAVALASLREQEGRVRLLEQQYSDSKAELARALAAVEAGQAEARAARAQAAEQVALAHKRAATDAAAVRARAADELAAITEELTRVRSALASVRRHAAERAAGLERRLGELETALAAERRAHAAATTELAAERRHDDRRHGARTAPTRTPRRPRSRDGARRERRARAAAVTELETARAGLAAAEATNHAEAVARAALEEELDRERLARASLAAALATERSELTGARTRIAELELALEHHPGASAAAGSTPGRIERAPRSARSASRGAPDDRRVATIDERSDFAAKLDAAAAALRAHAPRHEPAVAPAGEYPWLRAALVRLAHDDPRTAARLLVALVPAQGALVSAPLQYDLTIRGAGTYAISIAAGRATARGVREPRPRAQAAFHVTADVVTLAEVLAGVQKRMGRWIGSVKVQGQRRDAEALRDALVGAQLDLSAAARAGADLDPDLVWRALAYAIDPAWTKGHTFTIAQEISGPRPLRWHIAVRDGAPVVIERRAPAQPPDAVVAMSRAAFSHMLRAEPAPGGERPTIRGDRAAVATLKRWTDRAQGRAG